MIILIFVVHHLIAVFVMPNTHTHETVSFHILALHIVPSLIRQGLRRISKFRIRIGIETHVRQRGFEFIQWGIRIDLLDRRQCCHW